MTVENVTVLFTDMVGSTTLASSLAPDAADELRRGHFSILRQAVTETGGTEVKNLGDGLMVVFTTASAALSCAVAMQQGVERDNRRREPKVGLRVGLSGGEVTREEDDYFGDPVIEAARLCAIVDGSQVLAADVVRALAGRRTRHLCNPVGSLLLKGLPDPVETVEVAWEPLAAGAVNIVPLPGRLAVRPAVGVLGRDTETATIQDAYKRVAAGAGREVVLVSGEAGLGKSTLAAEAARSGFEAGACVLFGHCEEDLATPYQLFSEALGHYVMHAPEDELLADLSAHGSELAKLIPILASRIPELPPSTATDADTERYLVFAAVVALLVQVSQHTPIVLVLDDLQWADKASLQLLRHLSASEQPMHVLVLGTYRDSELSHSHPLLDTLAALRRQTAVSRVELTGLDDAAVVAFMEAAAGHALDDAATGLARAVYRETDGNPFFVGEVLRHLAETGAIYQDAGGTWKTDDSLEHIGLPDSVREVIGARVGRLGERASRVLSMAAVIGRDFDLALLSRSTTDSEDDLLDILEAAAAVALVREPADSSGRYNFAHALIQHTLYEDMGPNRRARAHRAVAEALEDLCGDRPGSRVGELARHWTGATQPSDLGKAISYSRQAGDAALAALAPADALRYYAQALDLYPHATDPDPVLGLDIAIGLGTAQRLTGDPVFRETLLGAARRAADLGDTERLVSAALANDRGWTSTVGMIDTEKVEVLEQLVPRLGSDDPQRALVLATLCAELSFGSALSQREALATEALAIARAAHDDATIVRVSNYISFPLLVPSLLEESLPRTADALERAERLGDPLLRYHAAVSRAADAARAGDLDEVDRCHSITNHVAEQLDQPSLKWTYAFNRCWRAQFAGDTNESERLAALALQIGTDGGEPDVAVFFGTQIMMIELQRGNLEGLLPLIEQTVAENPGLPGFVAKLAVAYAESDFGTQARELLEAFAAADFELPQDVSWLSGTVDYAEAAIQDGDPRFAGPLLRRLAPWAAQVSTIGGVTADGPVCHFLGGLATVMERYDEADAYFAASASLSERMDAKFFGARTDLMWGRMRSRRRAPGDREKAGELLTRARAAAAIHGYSNVERRAVEALGQLN